MSSTMTDAEFDAALAAALAELVTPRDDIHDRLRHGGAFVARFGALGDLYDTVIGVGQVQSALSTEWSSAGYLIAHWSIERGDPNLPDAEFLERHMPKCESCAYLEGARGVFEIFEHEVCSECGQDVEGHDIAPDQFGKAQAFCRSVWERHGPDWAPAGDAAEYQLGDAYSARWVAPLTDGTYAVITRTYYVGQIEEGQTYIEGVAYDEPFVERQDEYLVCRDPAAPGDTAVDSETSYVLVQSDDPAREDPRALATDAPEPDPGEWEENAPTWARDLLGAPTD